MRRNLNTLGLILSLGSCLTGTLRAQGRDRGIVEVGSVSRDDQRGGFYASLGLGAGRESYKYSDENNYSQPLTKPTLSVRLGGTPSNQVRVGGEIFAWGNDIDNGFESFTMLMLTGQYYLTQRGGFFFKGGAGFARSGTSYDDGGSAYESGFGLSAGAGWELAVSRNVAIAPTIDFYSGSFTKRNEPTITERVVNIGVQISFQTGPKR